MSSTNHSMPPPHPTPIPDGVKELAEHYVHEVVNRNQIMMTNKNLVMEINNMYSVGEEPQGWSNVTDAAQGVLIAQIEFAVSYFQPLFEKPAEGLIAYEEVKGDLNTAIQALEQNPRDTSTANAKITDAISKLGTFDFMSSFSQLDDQWNAVINSIDQLTDALQNMITVEHQLQATYNQEVAHLHGDIASECAPLGLVCKAIQLASLAIGPEGVILAGAVGAVGATTMVLIAASIHHDLEKMQTTRSQIYEISHEQGKITEVKAHLLALNTKAREIQEENFTYTYFERQANIAQVMIEQLTQAIQDPSILERYAIEPASQQLPELMEYPTYSLLDMKSVDTTLHFGMTSQEILQSLEGKPSQSLMEWWLSQVS